MSIEQLLRTNLRKITLYPERIDEIALHDSLFAGGILDSLGLIQLISFLEEEFHLSIPLESVSTEQFSTLAGIINYIQKRKDNGEQ